MSLSRLKATFQETDTAAAASQIRSQSYKSPNIDRIVHEKYALLEEKRVDACKLRQLSGLLKDGERTRRGLEDQLRAMNEQNQAMRVQNRRLSDQLLEVKEELAFERKMIAENQLYSQQREEAINVEIQKLLRQNELLVTENNKLAHLADEVQLKNVDLRQNMLHMEKEAVLVQSLKEELLANQRVYESKMHELLCHQEHINVRQQELIELERQHLQSVKEFELEKQLLEEQNTIFKREIERRDRMLDHADLRHHDQQPRTVQTVQRHESPSSNKRLRSTGLPKTRLSFDTPRPSSQRSPQIEKALKHLVETSDGSLAECSRRNTRFIKSCIDMMEKVFGTQHYEGLGWTQKLQQAWQHMKSLGHLACEDEGH